MTIPTVPNTPWPIAPRYGSIGVTIDTGAASTFVVRADYSRVYWGDGTYQDIGFTNANTTHTYATPGIYNIFATLVTSVPSSGFTLGVGGVSRFSKNLYWCHNVTTTSLFNEDTSIVSAVLQYPNLGVPRAYNSMFRNCSNFTGLGVDDWENVAPTTTNIMFANSRCTQITDLTTWNMAGCSDLAYMFNNTSLGACNLSGWNLNACTNLSYFMSTSRSFNGDVSNWAFNPALNVSAVYTFNECNAFTGTGLSTWTGFKPSSLHGAFRLCESMQPQNLTAWNLSACTSLVNTFRGMTNFNLDTTGWTFGASAVDATGTFAEITGTFNNAGISSWVNFKPSTLSSFAQVSSIGIVDLSNWDMSACTFINNAFSTCASFNGDVSNWAFNPATTVSSAAAFTYCTAFTGTGLSTWTGFKPGAMNSMLAYTAITNPNLSGWDMTACTNMSSSFLGCASFNGNTTGWTFGTNPVLSSSAFQGCVNFTGTNVGTWVGFKPSNMSYMFYGCTAFAAANLTNWNLTSCTNMTCVFQFCPNFNGDTTGWTFGASTVSALAAFGQCTSFTGIGLNTWVNFNPNTVSNMFLASGVVSLDLTNWNMSACTNYADMCAACFSLTNLVLNWGTVTSLNMNGIARNCALTQTAVNNFLIGADSTGITTGTIGLNGGTNAAPTGAGLTAKNNLIAKGVTVTTN